MSAKKKSGAKKKAAQKQFNLLTRHKSAQQILSVYESCKLWIPNAGEENNDQERK